MTFIRSALFIPGNKASMLEKAFIATADAIVPDMEDSVPEQEKSAACNVIAEYLPRLRSTGKLIIPRVNSLNTGRTERELAAVVGPYIDAVSIGKIATPTDIHDVAQILGKLEADRGLEHGQIKLVPWIESAQAIINCYGICIASERTIAIAFGAEDFTHDMSIERSSDETQLLYARSTICIAARAANVLALDTPFFKFRDLEGLREHSIESKQLGFKGRFAIHPAQTDTINACYSPSEPELEQARRIVAAFEEAERRGRGSTSLDGLVIDVPVVKRARGVIAVAERAVQPPR